MRIFANWEVSNHGNVEFCQMVRWSYPSQLHITQTVSKLTMISCTCLLQRSSKPSHDWVGENDMELRVHVHVHSSHSRRDHERALIKQVENTRCDVILRDVLSAKSVIQVKG